MNNKQIFLASILSIPFLFFGSAITFAEDVLQDEGESRVTEVPKATAEEIKKMDVAVERYLAGTETQEDIMFLTKNNMINHLDELRVFSENERKQEEKQKELARQNQGNTLSDNNDTQIQESVSLNQQGETHYPKNNIDTSQYNYLSPILWLLTIANSIALLYLFWKRREKV